MSWSQELASWMSPTSLPLSNPPKIGEQAPSEGELQIPFPDNKPVVVAFLRHCGCPWAEKSFRNLREAAPKHTDIHFVAVSHSEKEHTDQWLSEIGGAGSVQVIIDAERKIYAKWGLGTASFWHILNPSTIRQQIALGKAENIGVRSTASGSRWQTSGYWAIDGFGTIVAGGPSEAASDLPNAEALVKKIEGGIQSNL